MSGFDYIRDNMYVGGDPEYSTDVQADIVVLNQNVDLIIDCRSATEAAMGGWADYSALEVPILAVPMYDDNINDNSPRDFLNAAELIAEQYPEAKSFYVHCHMGVNRGPSMAMFLLITRFDMTALEAFKLLRAQRHGVGVAYAEQAVAASLIMSDGQVDADINRWIQFEDAYWTPEAQNTVRDRIYANRRRSEVGRMTAAGKYVRGN